MTFNEFTPLLGHQLKGRRYEKRVIINRQQRGTTERLTVGILEDKRKLKC